MPKLDLSQVIQMKDVNGEIVRIKGNGFEWSFTPTGGEALDVSFHDLSAGILHGGQTMVIADLSSHVLHGGRGMFVSDLSTQLVHGPVENHILFHDLNSAVIL